MRKYRAEKSLMANLSNAKQQLGPFPKWWLVGPLIDWREKLQRENGGIGWEPRNRKKEGKVMIDSKKNLPTNPFYKAVLIKESRRKATNDVDYDDIVDDCDYE